LIDRKKKIAESFSRYSGSYERYATLQKRSARVLLDTIESQASVIPQGPILEIGCGSGFLSDYLAKSFQERPLDLVDIAPGMLTSCRNYLRERGLGLNNIRFMEMDAESIEFKERYGLIVSGLTVQWFANLSESLLRIYQALLPGGVFIFSFPAVGSFPEWRQQCERNKLLCTLNPLPDGKDILSLFDGRAASVVRLQKDIILSFPSVRDFFRSLKKTGAGVNVRGGNLNSRELKQLSANWQEEDGDVIRLTCKVDYFTITKNGTK